MRKKILVPLAEGFEEIEAVTIIDILRRAGALVITAGINKRNVTGSHKIKVVADSVLNDELEKQWDLIVLPGGVPGTPNLADTPSLVQLIKVHYQGNKPVAAICAAPYVFEQAGILSGKKFTSHPGWVKKMKTGDHQGKRTVIDGNIITGQAAGSAMEFAFKLVERLYGKEKVIELNKGVLAPLDVD